jgi:membrane associated rhomboid family serine protease
VAAAHRTGCAEGHTSMKNWGSGVRIIVALVALLWLIEAANTMLGHRLNQFGIYPRNLQTLPGIVVWPLLHVNFQHLIMNTTPLLVLGFFVALRGLSGFLVTTAIIVIMGGVGVWVFGRPAYHIGASALVFGYFGFLLAAGVYERSFTALAVAVFVLSYYGGLIYGVIPVDSFISWEAHLFGLLAGVYAARTLRRRRRPTL